MESSKKWATPLAKRLIKERKIKIESIKATGSNGEIKARDILHFSKTKYTPMARNLANKFGLDLNGFISEKRIRKEDVINYMAVKANQKVLSAENIQIVPLTSIKRVIGLRMSKAHNEIPPVTMNIKADVTKMLQERTKRNTISDMKLTINDYVIHACAKALAETPSANISFSPDGIIYKNDINIGVAVALENGLIVPVIRNADKLSLEQISVKMKELANKAKTGALGVDDYTGGTFTISNLGMYGITSFTPIINLPETLILGVCSIEKNLTLDENGDLINRSTIGLSITFDHRAHDGAQAALFLNKIVNNLELRGINK